MQGPLSGGMLFRRWPQWWRRDRAIAPRVQSSTAECLGHAPSYASKGWRDGESGSATPADDCVTDVRDAAVRSHHGMDA